ncbi:MAG: RHS repeat-associated core domain-containing protein [Verrucomicrobiota bacterium]
MLRRSESIGDYAFDTSGDIYIGGRPFTEGFWQNGRLDELSLYNRPLSSIEVADIHAAGSSGKCKPSVEQNAAPTLLVALPRYYTIPNVAMPATAFVTDDGLPANSDITVTWSVASGPDTPTWSQSNFVNPSNGKMVNSITFAVGGTYGLVVEATDGDRITRKELEIIVREIENHAPIVDAGDTARITLPTDSVALLGFAIDDGYPTSGVLSRSWSVVSGPAPVAFADASAFETLATFTLPGSYELELAVSDGDLTSTDIVVVEVEPKQNEEATILITGATSHNLALPMTLSADVTDDGYPFGGNLVATWQLVSGPGSAIFAPPTVDFGTLNETQINETFETSVSFDEEGTYTVELVVSDGEFAAREQFDVAVFVLPEVALVLPVDGAVLNPNGILQLGADAEIAVGSIASVEFFVNDASVGLGAKVEGTTRYELDVPLASLGLSNERAAVDAIATSGNGRIANSVTNTIVVADASADLPDATIESPAVDSVLTEPTAVIGTVTSEILDSWVLEYRLEGELDWIALSDTGDQNSEFTAEELGTFDPTLLLNGIYELRLSATDLLGRTITDTITISVDGEMKVGNFALAFEDLTVPMAGIPIQIIRSYDSRDTRMGDFGTGWTLAINDIRLRKNGILGASWFHEQIATTFAGQPSFNYCLEPLGQRLVSIVFPDGEQYLFEMSIDVGHGRQDIPDNCQLFSPIRQAVDVVFTPRGDTTGSLEAFGVQQVYNEGFVGPTSLYTTDPSIDFGAALYDPTRFILTTSDGTRYLIDENEGLISMEDLNGNTLEVFDDRIVSTTIDPNGGPAIIREVAFIRDGEGRITTITDPDGNSLDYVYEVGQDGLSAFTNRVGETTEFIYADSQFPDYLTDILDPRGIQAIRTEYDDEGRILRQIDADGNPINFNHDLDNFAETVTDRLGNPTIYYYDVLGNVTRQVDPLGAETLFEYYPGTTLVKYETDDLGNVTSRAYDEEENLLVEITGASNTEEPLAATIGFITRYTYNEFSSPLSITDPNGNLTEFTYDIKGNLLSQIQYGDGGETLTTGFTYNGNGEIKTITDAEGNVTSYTYSYGITDPEFTEAVKRQLVFVTDAIAGVLRVTESLYDRQENLLVERFNRTLPDNSTESVQTSYLYDEENRLVATFLPDGQVAETRYNNIGKEAASIRWQSAADYQSDDLALARVTSMQYDGRGNLIRTDYPDGTFTRMGYNLEGRMIWSTNQLGEVAAMAYDALGRQTHIVMAAPEDPDADALAALSWNTFVEMPAALQDNPATETIYDSIGRVEFTIDPVGNLTQNVYDDTCACAGRLKETRAFPDSNDLANFLSTSYLYDENGNQRFVTDPKGYVTEFIYDAYNRLTRTNHPATSEHGATNTQTVYDDLGRRVATIDEESRRTDYEYDALGRLTKVIQPSPDGIVARPETTYTYDEAGNRLTETDAEGNTTRFEYDNMGRRTKRILAEDQEETYLYNDWGELESRTDFNGHTTSYTYDDLSRLLTERADATAFPTEVGITYTYDALGRIETMIDAAGTTTHDYDERGNLLSKSNAVGTLTYTYDDANNLDTVASDSAGGLNLSYDYDGLNRLSTVYDEGADQPALEHGYTYDANGNLESLSYSNGVVHTWTYDARNRLKNLSILDASFSTLQSFSYELKATGHRSKINEGSGRVVEYTYDHLYRLTQEMITGSANPIHNGTSDWSYDLVGNRLSQISDIDKVLNLAETYSDNNWLDSHTYDSNGNTTLSAPYAEPVVTLADYYDWRNRLVRREKSDGTVIEVVYDGHGDRIEKRVQTSPLELPTSYFYLVDRNNLTGYAQVVEEIAQGGDVQVIYSYGLDLISQDRYDADTDSWEQHFYFYDGLGSVRALTDSTGTTTDEYVYDAWGVLLESTGSTDNSFKFTGEQWDADLEMYFLRARYLNTSTGRFHTMDTFEGVATDPITLHKYLYANAVPTRFTDPSGFVASVAELNVTVGVIGLTLALAVPSTQKAIQDFGEEAIGVAGEIGSSAFGKAQQAAAAGIAASVLVLNSTRAAIEEAIKGLSEAQKRARRRLKVVPQPWSLFPAVVANITARTGGSPQLLTRTTPTRARQNRRAAIRGRGPAGAGFSWDEYPFASTTAGGAGARVARVPLRENLRQGGVIGAAYRIQGIKPGDTFWMVTLP